ncbi:hypothetical protein FRX31_025034 [Thalictrum thalictroides]|uniref:Uncharacterized protein n=1 Tax=Thalictrum thalictroides TaxID=46969 RepID=A0A7J6VMK8_THATH|nr:hypothetical protein FRX31_025034 [Thalictrum thalictroides]
MEDTKFLEWRAEKMKEEEQRKRGSWSPGLDSQVKILTNGQECVDSRDNLVTYEQTNEQGMAGNLVTENLLRIWRNKDADMVELNGEKLGTDTDRQLSLTNEGEEGVFYGGKSR